jgi:hypothetical protein
MCKISYKFVTNESYKIFYEYLWFYLFYKYYLKIFVITNICKPIFETFGRIGTRAMRVSGATTPATTDVVWSGRDSSHPLTLLKKNSGTFKKLGLNVMNTIFVYFWLFRTHKLAFFLETNVLIFFLPKQL